MLLNVFRNNTDPQNLLKLLPKPTLNKSYVFSIALSLRKKHYFPQMSQNRRPSICGGGGFYKIMDRKHPESSFIRASIACAQGLLPKPHPPGSGHSFTVQNESTARTGKAYQ